MNIKDALRDGGTHLAFYGANPRFSDFRTADLAQLQNCDGVAADFARVDELTVSGVNLADLEGFRPLFGQLMILRVFRVAITSLEFARAMPKLAGFVLGECGNVLDLTPLSARSIRSFSWRHNAGTPDFNFLRHLSLDVVQINGATWVDDTVAERIFANRRIGSIDLKSCSVSQEWAEAYMLKNYGTSVEV